MERKVIIKMGKRQMIDFFAIRSEDHGLEKNYERTLRKYHDSKGMLKEARKELDRLLRISFLCMLILVKCL